MRICLIAEGSFPYVTGGVSSWITSLVTEMPEHEFIIFAIGAESKQKGKFKCELPPNIVEVHEIFLDAHRGEKTKWGKRYSFSPEEFETLSEFLKGSQSLQWDYLFKLLRSDNLQAPMDFCRVRIILTSLKNSQENRTPLFHLLNCSGPSIQ